jgi:hypothetical protein
MGLTAIEFHATATTMTSGAPLRVDSVLTTRRDHDAFTVQGDIYGEGAGRA